MATVTGLTAARMAEIEAASIVDGQVVGNNLILTRHDETTIDAGNVRGPAGTGGESGAPGTTVHSELSNLSANDHPQYLLAANHTKAAHDALLIDAATLDGIDSTGFSLTGHNHDAAYLNVSGDTMTGDLLLGTGAQIDFYDEVGDKIYFYSNLYGIGMEAATLTNWSNYGFRWRVGGTSVDSGTESMLLDAGNLTLVSQKLKFNSGVGDKIYLFDNVYGMGVEANTLTNWSSSQFRWRVGGTSVSTGTEKVLLTASALSLASGVQLSVGAAFVADTYTNSVQAFTGTGPYLAMAGSTVLVQNRGNAGYIPLIVRGMASQLVDLQQWQRDDGYVLASMGLAGNIRVNSYFSSYTADGLFGATALPSKVTTPGGKEIRFGYLDDGSGSYVPRIGFYQAVGGNVVAAKNSIGNEINGDFTIKVGASDTERIRVTAGGILRVTQIGHLGGAWSGTINFASTSIEVDGGVGAGGALLSGTNFSAQSGFPTYVGAIVRGASGQTADLQQWQDSAGSALARIASEGSLFATGVYSSGLQALTAVGPYIATSGSGVGVQNRTNAAYVPFSIYGMAGQTGDLQQWKDSAGNIKALVSAAGNLSVGTLTSAHNGYTLKTEAYTVDLGLGNQVGGWARAFRVVNNTGSNGYDGGAFGVLGTGNTPSYVYMSIPTSNLTGFDSTKIIAITNGGNVGIGTVAPTPTAKLEVSGGGVLAYNFVATRSGGLFAYPDLSGTGGLVLGDNGSGANSQIALRTTGEIAVDGNVRLYNDTITLGVGGLRVTGFGYGPTTYRVLQVGASVGVTESVAIGIDPSTIAGGAFTGTGIEVLFRRGVRFMTPNAAGTDFHPYNFTLQDGGVGIGTYPGHTLHTLTTSATDRIMFQANIAGSNQNSNSPKLTLTGQYYDVGISLQAINIDSYGRKRLGIFTHDANDYTTETEVFSILPSGRIGIGTTAPSAQLDVLRGITTNVVNNLAQFGYGGDLSNRSINIQQIGNASTTNQFILLNGSLGSGSVTGTPTFTSAYARAWGLESTDSSLSIVTAAAGTNQAVTRPLTVSFGAILGISISVPLDMGAQVITNVANPTTGDHVADRDYNDIRYVQVVNYPNDGVAPAQVTGVVATAGFESLFVEWAANTEADMINGWGNYHIQVDNNADFSSLLYDKKVGSAFAAFSGLPANTLLYIRVRAIDAHGNPSAAWSTTASGTPMQVVAGDLADNSVTTGSLQANAITAGKLAANSVTAAAILAGTITATEIAAGTITGVKIAANAIDTNHILANTIQAGDIAANTITANEIAANAITASELAAFSVIAGKIAAGTIVAADIAADTITGAKIAAGTITASEIAAGTITSTLIAADTITAGNIAADSIGASEIIAGSITSVEIAADTIIAGNIAAGAITASELAANSVIAGKIAADTIVAADIAADTITGAKIAAGTITASELSAGSVTAASILAGTITSTEIAAGTIIASDIASGTITATQIAANTITAGQILAGTITATQIAADTITAIQIAANAITATELSANAVTAVKILAGEITADKLASSIVLASKYIQLGTGSPSGLPATSIHSGNWVSATSGFLLNGATGAAEFNSLTVRGTADIGGTTTISSNALITGALNVTSGSVQGNWASLSTGWKLFSTGSAEFNGALHVGGTATVKGSLIIGNGSAGAVQSDNWVANSLGFKITRTGTAEFNNTLFVAGATTLCGTVTVGWWGYGQLKSQSYSAGVSGWTLMPNGDVEFNSLLARGDVKALSISFPESTAILSPANDAGGFGASVGAWVGLTRSSTVAHTATYSGQFSTPYGESWTTAYLDISNPNPTRNQWYRVEAWVYTAASCQVVFGVAPGASDDRSVDFVPTVATWTKVQVHRMIPAGQNMRVSLAGSTGFTSTYIYIDDITITPISGVVDDLNVQGDIRVLSGATAKSLPRGLIKRALYASTATTSGTTELSILTMKGVRLTAGRDYEVKYHSECLIPSDATGVFLIKLYVDSVAVGQTKIQGTGRFPCDIVIPFSQATDKTNAYVYVTCTRTAGAGTASLYGDHHLWLQDVGETALL